MTERTPDAELSASAATSAQSAISRRAVVGGALATGVWVAPSIVRLDRVAAATPSCTVSNVALNKPVTASSPSWTNMTLEGGVNGDTNGAMSATRNGFHTQRGVNEWYEIDLGADFCIQEVRLWPRTDCCQSRVRDVRISVDGPTVGVAPGVINTSPTVVVPAAGTTGQFIRLTNGNPASTWFHLVEVEVIGCLA